ncbi:MAG: hypothetical protein NC347_12470 [Clostridium sp.]|nr:hypothetical protein [Clostridium sp.]MCM1181066.1 hypothetical protein [Clostridium sp.]
MVVKCLSNSGDAFIKATLGKKGGTPETVLPIRVNSIYTVYGQVLSKGIMEYLILGEGENYPSWYPAELFEIIDDRIYFGWMFNYRGGDDISAVWGYEELVRDEDYIYNLEDREELAIQMFLDRKKEIDEANEW